MLNTKIIDSAIGWLDAGVCPIPVKPKSKQPIFRWKSWQNTLPEERLVKKWFSDKERNLGLICGGSPNLCVIDFDDMAAYYEWKATAKERTDNWSSVAQDGYRVRTHRGYHVYIYTNKPIVSRKNDDGKIDLRTGNAHYVLAPPSIHPSGDKYKFLDGKIYTLTADEIEDLLPMKELEYRYKPNKELDWLDRIQVECVSNDKIISIKNKLPLAEYVRRFSKLYKGSVDGQWLYAHCPHPDHKDKHPSFRIDNAKNRGLCLTPWCSLAHPIGLDVIDIYSIINNCSNREAIGRLAFELGLE